MRTCYGIMYLRSDGIDSGRIDYCTDGDVARARLAKMTRIHGAHPNGQARWYLVRFLENDRDV